MSYEPIIVDPVNFGLTTFVDERGKTYIITQYSVTHGAVIKKNICFNGVVCGYFSVIPCKIGRKQGQN